MKHFFPFFPPLLGIFWVLAIYHTNQDALPDIAITYVPMIVVVGITCLAMLLFRVVLRDWRRSALVTSIIMVLSLSFAHFLPLDLPAYSVVCHRIIFPLWVVLEICACILVARIRCSRRETLCTIGNIVSVCLLLVVSFNIISGASSKGGIGDEPLEYHITIPAELPDIYYFVVDEHANFDTLKHTYDYDNSEFMGFLESRGFYVVPDAYSNYPTTILSMASSLNMEYLAAEDMQKETYLRSMIEDNEVLRILNPAGYQYVHVGTWWEPTARNRNADCNYNSSFSEFPWTLYRSTVFYSAGVALFGAGQDEYCRGFTLNQIEYLLEKEPLDREDNRPMFTLAHFIVPHEPWVFNADGSPVSASQRSSRTTEENYINQVQYIDSQLEEIVDTILERSEVPPIIIIQADEGPNPEEWLDYLDEHGNFQGIGCQEPEAVKVKMSALFACLIPGMPENTKEEFLSPTNTFRVVFNTLLDTDLDLLPNQYYISKSNTVPFDPIDVTEVLTEL